VSIAQADFDFVRGLVQRRSAILLEPGKEYLVESRLLPIAQRYAEGSLGGLVAKLRREDTLHCAVVEAMTTNETSWFRDAPLYAAFENDVLPGLMQARRTEGRLSLWSAACSSGQEAYTLAMLCHERLGFDPRWTVRILATDISTRMVERTRKALYSAVEMNRGLPAPRLVRHFAKDGAEWRVADPLRELVEARQMNLAAPFPALPRMDVVFLRNVLIYFDAEMKRAVLERVRHVLRPDGWLFLGSAETTLGIHSGYERVTVGPTTAYRLRGPGGGDQ
jgi:chemotaxis protein methyltransferase CheR